MDEVKSYADIIKSTRKNFHPEGFPFDVNTFENVIDAYTPEDQVPVVLNCSLSTLNAFCNIVYKMPFTQTYRFLSGITDMYMRRSIKGLASSGNTTALNIAREHFLKLNSEQDSHNVSVTFLDDRR